MTTINIAHAGRISPDAPNEVNSIKRVLHLPYVDGVELDIQMGQDGSLRLSHDEGNRCHVQGAAGKPNHSVATLDEVIPLLRSYARFIILDLKSAVPHELFLRLEMEGLVERTIVASFNSEYLPLDKTGLNTALIIGFSRESRSLRGLFCTIAGLMWPLRYSRRLGVSTLLCSEHRATARLVRRARTAGLSLFIWTTKPRSLGRLRKLLAMQPSGLISDNANVVAEIQKRISAAG